MSKLDAVWYGKLSGRFWRHPKALALSAGAGWLWTRALSYVVDQRTDGVVASAALRALEPKLGTKLAAELVASGLWEVHPAGHVFHDFADHGMTVASWEEKKKESAERAARSRAKKAAGNAPVTRDASAPDAHVTRTQVSADSGLRTQDSGSGGETRPPPEPKPPEPASPFAENLETLWRRWAKSYAKARGQVAADDSGTAKREVCRVITEHAEARGVAFDEAADGVLERYWRDPWPRQHRNRASLQNLLGTLSRLLDEAGGEHDQAEDSDPPDYDPATHGPARDARNFGRWNAYLDRAGGLS